MNWSHHLLAQVKLTNLIYLGLISISLSLPLFSAEINSWLIVSTFFLILFQKNSFLKLRISFRNLYVLLFMSLYFLLILGMLYTQNMAEGFSKLERQISLLLFPLFITCIPKLSTKKFDNIFKSFIVACFVGTIICLYVSIKKLIGENRPLQNIFHYDIYYNFTNPLDIHYVYFSLYLVFCIILLIYLFPKQNSSGKLLLTFLGLFFSFLILLMASRMQVIILIIICVVTIFWFIRHKIWSFVVVVVVTTLIWLIISNMQFTSYQFQKLSETELALSTSQQQEGHKRLGRWLASLDEIGKNFFGVGTGDTQDILNEVYIATGMDVALDNQYNTHNEYLNFTIAFGIIGFVALLSVLFIPLYFSLKCKNYVYTMFIIAISLSFLTENILSRQNGVVFYSFFNALLGFHMLDLNKSSE